MHTLVSKRPSFHITACAQVGLGSNQLQETESQEGADGGRAREPLWWALLKGPWLGAAESILAGGTWGGHGCEKTGEALGVQEELPSRLSSPVWSVETCDS